MPGLSHSGHVPAALRVSDEIRWDPERKPDFKTGDARGPVLVGITPGRDAPVREISPGGDYGPGSGDGAARREQERTRVEEIIQGRRGAGFAAMAVHESQPERRAASVESVQPAAELAMPLGAGGHWRLLVSPPLGDDSGRLREIIQMLGVIASHMDKAGLKNKPRKHGGKIQGKRRNRSGSRA